MLDSIFHIPHAIAGIPMFGLGWALAAWGVFSVALLLGLVRKNGWNDEAWSYVPLLLMVGGLLWFVLPAIEERDSNGNPLGLPIRGFGTMVMTGALLGIALAVRRARQMGIDPEQIVTLSLISVFAGGLGARLFYIVQFWPEFRRETWSQSLLLMANFTQGGMVIYGGLLGGFAGGLTYLYRKKISMLAACDLVMPSLALGMAMGRIGCLCHGCCFGGVCDTCAWSISFPQGSPAYMHQLQHGQLHGIRLSQDPASKEVTVAEVDVGSAAEAAGVRPGIIVKSINGKEVRTLEQGIDVELGMEMSLVSKQGEVFNWRIESLPGRSRPVHPTQLYSAISSGLMCLVLWFFYPFRRRDGAVVALFFTLYPLARFAEEIIRDDQGGIFGLPLTIAQVISVLMLLMGLGFWILLALRPAGTVWPVNVTESQALSKV